MTSTLFCQLIFKKIYGRNSLAATGAEYPVHTPLRSIHFNKLD